jgi:NAD(P)-dependent dehydrogenase (short-subunit alcohol dehydrogenase family)
MAEIIVTGASGGIGSSLCRVFLDAGHRVLAISRKKSIVTPHSNLHWLQCSLSDKQAVKEEVALWSQGQSKRILIHNAGYMLRSSFEETEASDLDELMRVNLIYPWLLTQALLPWLRKGEVGHIIYISSMSGFQGSLKYPGLAAYGASKSAGNAWIESMAAEIGVETGLYFNALALGAVNTSMLEEAIPGTKNAVDVLEICRFISQFALEAYKVMNGSIVPVRVGNP